MNDTVVSNCVGPGGTPIDRLYGNLNGSLRLVQKDFSVYKGSITKKTLTKKDLTETILDRIVMLLMITDGLTEQECQ